ncbi:class I SAM-dependent methyltransferase [Pendulispora albinea]|uniref:S-adenosyl-L-methionine-dependent methyltransferase n=1 Tax=Pendulispora albinea TaxID=2741071 RepID=A0ABZ2LR79_9BACT
MRDALAATVFYGTNVLLAPITLAGYAIWVTKSVARGNAAGVSSTAQGPLSARYFEHNLGTRPDEPANRLMMALPGVPRLGVRLISGPMLLAHRLTGYVPKAFRYPFEGPVSPQYETSARVAFFDDAVERYVHRGEVDQFVVLGAGFDTRAFRLPNDTRVRSFEVDTPKTQAVKREALAKVDIDASAVTFVAADFERDDWLARLEASGFDRTKPALFLWEGVTMYLDRRAIEETLRKIATTAKGSALAFDYFTTESLESKALYWRYARATTTAVKEKLKFGVDSTPPTRDRLAELLTSCGLSLTTHRTLGEETTTERAWGGFAIATVDR